MHTCFVFLSWETVWKQCSEGPVMREFAERFVIILFIRQTSLVSHNHMSVKSRVMWATQDEYLWQVSVNAHGSAPMQGKTIFQTPKEPDISSRLSLYGTFVCFSCTAWMKEVFTENGSLVKSSFALTVTSCPPLLWLHTAWWCLNGLE